MHTWVGLALIAVFLQQASPVETRIVQYLKSNVTPGRPVVVSELYNNVFKTPEEQKVLERLYNTFFKVPMFIVQYNTATKKIPTLREISEQFNFNVPGEADVILRIMESDPRVPKFIERNPKTGEITKVDVELIKSSPQFSRVIERSIAGYVGKEAPAFSIMSYDAKPVTSDQYRGQPHLVYFWFTNCPPCVRTSPILAELYNKYSSKGFKVVGANADQFLELPYDDKVRADYAKKYGFNFTLAHLNTAMQQNYGGVSVFPTMFFVDKSGTIVQHFVNFQERATLEAAIQQTLGK
ncbi:MAG TPA: TlpA disulfide reductase family protein [Pyrinomonadaceae bacterium]|nr:TlpA disulfide reductase family protein [Pyrinomonadaceae bacterium]